VSVCACACVYIHTYKQTSNIHRRGAVKKFPEFSDIEGLMHHEFVPPGQCVTSHLYEEILERLRDAVQRKRRDKWNSGAVVSAVATVAVATTATDKRSLNQANEGLTVCAKG
jgi:hypothetical protein